MDFDDFEDFGGDAADMGLPDMGGMDGGMVDLPPMDMGDPGAFAPPGGFSGMDDFSNLSFSGIGDPSGGFSGDFGGGFSSASLPPLDSVGTTTASMGAGAVSAPPIWVPNTADNNGTFHIMGSRDNRKIVFCCCCMFTVLVLLMAALLAVGIVIIVKVNDIEYDVNHLRFVTVQDVNPPPPTLPPEILLPY